LVSILLLAMAYFLEGLGYIVTATFIVAIIATTPGLETFAPSSWVAVGLAAVPSTILWPYLARRIGNKRALLAAYAIQIAGILVSRHATSVFEVIFAAVTFGGTFLGIVALTMAEGNLRMGKDGRRAAAFLTASFSVGQMLGPVIAGMLADRQDGFAMPLLLAAASVTLGCLFIALDRQYQLHKL
jgi:predicted MFS family arabinose efflux permease